MENKTSYNNTSVKRTVFVALMALFAFFGAKDVLKAQNYCIPYPKEGCRYNYDYSRYNEIERVKITSDDGEVVLDNSSGNTRYRFYEDLKPQLTPGTWYTVEISVYGYFYSYKRLFIDWDKDGEFRNRDYQEYYGYTYNYYRNNGWNPRYSYWGRSTSSFRFQVPREVTETVRLRVMASRTTNYYYRYTPYQYLRDMSDACLNGNMYDYRGYVYIDYAYQYYYGETEDYQFEVAGGVKDTYPSDGDILFADEAYDGTTRMKNGEDVYFQKPTIIFPSKPEAGAKVYFNISGPAPSEEIVYEGLAEYPSTSNEIDVTDTPDKEYIIQHAEGKYAFPKAPFSDGTFKANRGGTYKVYAYMLDSPMPKRNKFVVSWDDDLAVSDIVSPRTNVAPAFFKYVRGQSIKVIGLFRNVGLNDVKRFYGIAQIWDPDGELVYRDSAYYAAPPREVLETGEDAELEFRNARFTRTGVYEMEIEGFLLETDNPDYAGDQDDYNDRVARDDENEFSFEVSYEIQLQASEIIAPEDGEVLIANRPIIPLAEFRNVGIGDASDIPASMVVKNEDGEIVYESNIIVQDVPSGKYNTKVVKFDQMAISEPGNYTVCIWLTAEEDVVREDDTLCTSFTVDAGLRGTYTVGRMYDGEDRNFPTIDSVMNELYLRGITGPIVFELTDAEYNLENTNADQPVWDFRSKIIGLGMDEETEQVNTITFKAHRSRANTRGGVQINMNSASGIGLMFGQSVFPSNNYAIMSKFPSPSNANLAGHIIIDGGKQKAIEFTLNSESIAFGAAIYLGRGSENISVKNVIVNNGTPAIKNSTRIPLVTYDPTLGFTFEDDIAGSGTNLTSYSVGILSRSSLVRFEESEFLRLDTIPNSNNMIEGNEISGFGYGLVSIGIGPLYMQNDNEYRRFYNSNNHYKDNMIHNVARAGMFFGYEEASDISGNRIYNIDGMEDAAGIMAGGQSDGDMNGYNNIGLNITGNEISDVSSDSFVHGIRAEQVLVTFPNPAGGEILFPDKAEELMITNNVVWGLEAEDESAAVAGIHLFTRRDESKADALEMLITPDETDYMTRMDKVSNNTVIISDDNGTVNSSVVVGIGLQNTKNAYVHNNAVLFEDNSLDANSPVASAFFFQGMKEGSFMSDRNAMWLGNSDASFYRFIETDDESNILEAGSRNEFTELPQWQLWTGQDANSVVGDFSNDMDYFGNPPYELRIDGTPVGSVLNNRGERLSYLSSDIDGNPRGSAGQRYDIGAFEFAGSMYVSDVEMLNIPSPGAYRSGDNAFSDAEYIMTQAPVNVEARIRNNGSLQQSDINVYVKIYREDIDGSYMADPVVEETMKASVASTQSMFVDFKLADMNGTEFVPQTFTELEEDGHFYDVPYQFSSMTENVTPKYRIVVSVESDQQNSNNIIDKEVRFYLKRSALSLLLSTENSMRNVYAGTDEMPDVPSYDEIAGRLNADSLIAGLHGIGWFTDAEIDRYDIDLFDRKGWEPRSVNYTMYRTMFWSDGNDDAGDTKGLSRYQRMDVEEFLNEGSAGEEKKNLILGSQEIVRELATPGTVNNYDPEFVNKVLRAVDVAPSNPLGAGVSNDGNTVIGETVGRNLVEEISSTDFMNVDFIDNDGNMITINDMAPYAGLMDVHPTGDGLARVAYRYQNSTMPEKDIMGVATTSLSRNVILLGVDWRHWTNIERVLRSVLDFVEKNGGTVVPVELAGFDAVPVGKRVDITWATASEYNSARFEIERADMNEAGRSDFVRIDETDAAGTSSSTKEYGPFADYNVDYGRSYVYRLKMVDLDGQYEYSSEKVVTIGESEGGIVLGEAMPNPVSDEAKFELSLNNSLDMNIALYDIAGKQVSSVHSGTMEAGSRLLSVDTKSLSSGTYTLILRSGDVVITRNIRVIK